MSRDYDPLNFIPSPDVLRRKLAEAETLARRLRVVLEVSERIRDPEPASSSAEPAGVARG